MDNVRKCPMIICLFIFLIAANVLKKFVVDSHTNTYFNNARYLKKQKRFGQFPKPLFRIQIVCFGNW